MENTYVVYLVAAALATWRITHLCSKEDGPFDFIYMIRKKAGNSFWGSLLDCFYCTSVWAALPFGIWLGNGWKERLLMWLAFSGAACLLEQATAGNNNRTHMQDYEEDQPEH